MSPILNAENIDAGYGDVIIVHNVSVKADGGEIVAIVGPNGSGKSTMIKGILGFAKLFHGQVFYQGQDVTGMPPDRLINSGIGYVPQINNVFPNLTIAENLDMGAYHRKGEASIKSSLTEIYDMFPELKARKNALANQFKWWRKANVSHSPGYDGATKSPLT